MRHERPFVWKSHWKCLGLAYRLGGSGSKEIARVGIIVLDQLMETQTSLWPAGSIGGTPREGTVASATTSPWVKPVPQLSF